MTFPEKWAIVAPSAVKARIIMGYIIDHLFDNPLTENALEIDKTQSSIRRLQLERSKNRLTFNLGTKNGKPLKSEIFIVSADSRNKQNAGDSVMGLGSPNVVLDEAALIDNNIESKIFRMLGDNMDNFYLKIGNPFKRNHFYETDKDPDYFKMNIDYHIGIKEGRITEKHIAEARKRPNFDVLFENKFPDGEMVDSAGYSPLILEEELERAIYTLPKESWIGKPRLSVDVAGEGSNQTVWTLRFENYAKILAVSAISDTMEIANVTVRYMTEHNVHAYNVFIDANGIGKGVFDRLHQKKIYVRKVIASQSADIGEDDDTFLNRRAQNYWRMRKWIMEGGKLDEEHRDYWFQILDVRYKTMDNKKIQIMPKLMMLREGIESPDAADALAQSFDELTTYDQETSEDPMDDFDPRSLI